MPRTTGLQAPVMELTGHSGEVFCAKFDPNGNYIASGSMDRTISEHCYSPQVKRYPINSLKCSGEPLAIAKIMEP